MPDEDDTRLKLAGLEELFDSDKDMQMARGRNEAELTWRQDF